ncbi:hypothetical protein SK128_004116 [Halocaridina rubra]|uniref:Uncharacterized protein n=1 Tax=Halocaridina rubra TaxID=373956 RepID=A0AAN8WRV5_HALRR
MESTILEHWDFNLRVAPFANPYLSAKEDPFIYFHIISYVFTNDKIKASQVNLSLVLEIFAKAYSLPCSLLSLGASDLKDVKEFNFVDLVSSLMASLTVSLCMYIS